MPGEGAAVVDWEEHILPPSQLLEEAGIVLYNHHADEMLLG